MDNIQNTVWQKLVCCMEKGHFSNNEWKWLQKNIQPIKIQESYVSFEIAKLLKEKGFKENVLHRYSKVGNFVQESYYSNWNFQTIDYSAPSHALAMKWIRELYYYHITIDCIDFLECGYVYSIKIVNLKNFKEIKLDDTENSYEDACEAGIEYCLKELI